MCIKRIGSFPIVEWQNPPLVLFKNSSLNNHLGACLPGTVGISAIRSKRVISLMPAKRIVSHRLFHRFIHVRLSVYEQRLSTFTLFRRFVCNERVNNSTRGVYDQSPKKKKKEKTEFSEQKKRYVAIVDCQAIKLKRKRIFSSEEYRRSGKYRLQRNLDYWRDSMIFLSQAKSEREKERDVVSCAFGEQIFGQVEFFILRNTKSDKSCWFLIAKWEALPQISSDVGRVRKSLACATRVSRACKCLAINE
jgi:hypothetical protein